MTLEQMIQKIILKLSQVPGVGVQVYSEDRIALAVQQIFNTVFEENFWPEFDTRMSRILSGADGLITQVMTDITQFTDIHSIRVDGSRRPLTQLPDERIAELETGTIGRWVIPHSDPGKFFKIVPFTATGTVYIRGRARPADFELGDTIPLDADLFLEGATWELLESEGGNPAAAEMFQTKFEVRLKQIKKRIARIALDLNPTLSNIPLDDDWREY